MVQHVKPADLHALAVHFTSQAYEQMPGNQEFVHVFFTDELTDRSIERHTHAHV